MWDRYLGYETFTLRYFIERWREVNPEQLHQHFDIGHRTLYDTMAHIIYNLETWTDLMRERPVRDMPTLPDDVDECLARFDAAMADFASCVHDLQAAQRLEETY